MAAAGGVKTGTAGPGRWLAERYAPGRAPAPAPAGVAPMLSLCWPGPPGPAAGPARPAAENPTKRQPPAHHIELTITMLPSYPRWRWPKQRLALLLTLLLPLGARAAPFPPADSTLAARAAAARPDTLPARPAAAPAPADSGAQRHPRRTDYAVAPGVTWHYERAPAVSVALPHPARRGGIARLRLPEEERALAGRHRGQQRRALPVRPNHHRRRAARRAGAWASPPRTSSATCSGCRSTSAASTCPSSTTRPTTSIRRSTSSATAGRTSPSPPASLPTG